MDWITKIIEALKLPTKFIFCIFAVSLALIILPQPILVNFHLNDFATKYGLYIGIVAISSGVLLVTESIIYLWNLVLKRQRSKKAKKSALDRLKRLDPAEKSVLREFFLQGQNTIQLPMDHPVVAGLLTSGILVLVGQQGRMSLAGMLFSMKISEYIRDQLTYEIIDLPTGAPTERDLEFLRGNRPSFMKSIERERSIFEF